MTRSSWVPWVAGGVAAVGVGTVVVAARRRARGPREADPIRGYATRFFLSHEALRRNLDRFVAMVDHDETQDHEAFGALVRDYAEFLRTHHESEDRFLFPALRRCGALRSTDAAHVAEWTAEHRAVNALADTLARCGDAIRAGGRKAYGELRGTVLELDELLRPHLAAEEQLINAERLAEMMTPGEVAAMERQLRKQLFTDERMLLFYMHSLGGAEQRQVLGAAPALFRRLILPRMDRKLYARIAPIALEPTLLA